MLLAVYGTLKRGHNNHTILHSQRFVGEALTCTNFNMGDSGFPVLLSTNEGHPVLVEVFDVDERALRRCDLLEGSMYTREKTTVEDKDGNQFEVSIYVGDPLFWTRTMQYHTPVNGVLNWPLGSPV